MTDNNDNRYSHLGTRAAEHPDKAAFLVADTGESVTYGELDRRSNQAAQLFRALGLKAGDHLAVLMENNAYYFEVVWAAQRSGLIYTCISNHLQPDEIAYILENSDASLLVASADLAETANQAISEVPNEVKMLLAGLDDEQSPDSYDAQLRSQPAQPIPDQSPGVDMLYSSGTTGRPKGVAVSLSGDSIEAMPAVLVGLGALYDMTEETVYLSPAPLYHAAPLRFCMLTLFCGGTVVVMRKFDAQRALELIEKHRVTHSQWVPIMFIRMLKLPNYRQYDVSSMQVAVHAAAPCPPDVKQQMIDWWGPVIYEYYSCTEGIGLTCLNTEAWLSHKGSVGKSLVGEVRILDDEGKELPAGEVGDVFFANGPEFHYHKDPSKTAEAKSEQGWYGVGDVGRLDEDGFLYLTDRKAFMIISGGVNIYPQEVENLLSNHPKVADVAVIGVPDEEFGESVKAVVQAVEGEPQGDALAAELIGYCRERLSPIKCPRSVDFDPQLPRYPNGKLYKKKVRDRYWP